VTAIRLRRAGRAFAAPKRLRPQQHTGLGNAPVFSPDGDLVLFVVEPVVVWAPGEREGRLQKPGEVLVWDWERRQVRSVLRGHSTYVDGVSFAPDGSRIVTQSSMGFSSTSSPDERTFTVLGDGTVRIWDSWSGKELAVIEFADRYITEVTFSPRGDLLLAGQNVVELYRRLRPEQWWGVLEMWQLWTTAGFAMALLWSTWHGVRVAVHAGRAGRVGNAP
jgi:hypothetical protein